MAELMQERDQFVEDQVEGNRKVMTERFALIVESHIAHTWTGEEVCSIEQVGEKLTTIFHGIAVRKSQSDTFH